MQYVRKYSRANEPASFHIIARDVRLVWRVSQVERGEESREFLIAFTLSLAGRSHISSAEVRQSV